MQATESADLLDRFLSQSSVIDVGDVSIVFLKYLVGRNVLQAVPVSKIKDWDKVIPLFTKGVVPTPRGSQLFVSIAAVSAFPATSRICPDGWPLSNIRGRSCGSRLKPCPEIRLRHCCPTICSSPAQFGPATPRRWSGQKRTCTISMRLDGGAFLTCEP